MACLSSATWSVAGCLGVLLCGALCACSDSSEASLPSLAPVHGGVDAALATADLVGVIVSFREPPGLSAQSVADRRSAIEQLGERIRARAGDGLQLSHRYRTIAAFAGRASRAALARLQRDPEVASIQLDARGTGQLKESAAASGVERVRALHGLTGKGVRIAVLDSGAETTHPDLKDAIVAQKCFAQGSCGNWASTGDTAEDEQGHGTAVSGIIASRGGVSSPGFAPEAELIVVKVLNGMNFGYLSDWIAAMEWLTENQPALHVSVVNLSLATAELYPDAQACEEAQPALTTAIKNLLGHGISVVAAAGNLGSTEGIPAPACVDGVISVGSAYDAPLDGSPPDGANYRERLGTGFVTGSAFADCRDERTMVGLVTCYTNIGERLDVVVPSAPILTDARGGGTSPYAGTSLSAAAISGIAALARQCNDALAPAQLREALIATGEARLDVRSGRMIPVVNALPLVHAVCPSLLPPTPDAGVEVAPEPEIEDAGKPEVTAPVGPKRGLGERFAGGAPAPPLESPASDAGESHDAGEREMDEVNDRPRVSKPRKNDYSCRSAGSDGGGAWLAGFIWATCWLSRRRRRSPGS